MASDKGKDIASNGEATPKRKPGFQKGQSGNPAGRHKMTEEEKEARRDALEMFTKAAPDAAAYLIGLVMDTSAPGKERRQAAEVVLDRALGKAVQQTESKVALAAVEITDEEARAALEALGYVRK